MASYLEARADRLLIQIDDAIAVQKKCPEWVEERIRKELERRSPEGQKIVLDRLTQGASALELEAKKAMKHEMEAAYNKVVYICSSILDDTKD